VAREINKVADSSKNLLGAIDHFQAGVGERDVVRPALHQLCADLALELAHLHGQRRLAYRAVLRCPPEMSVTRERGQIT
jgi:hypothetical protein